MGFIISAIGSITSGRAQREQARLQSQVVRRKGELDLLFNTIQEHNLWDYAGGLQQFYGGQNDLHARVMANAENKYLETSANEQMRHEGTIGILDQKGVLAENVYLDKIQENDMRRQLSESQLGLDVFNLGGQRVFNQVDFAVDTGLIQTGAQRQRIGLHEKGVGLFEQGIGLGERRLDLENQGLSLLDRDLDLSDRRIGLEQRGIGLQEKGLNLAQAGIGLRGRGLNLAQAGIGLQEKDLGLVQSGLGLQEKGLGLDERGLSIDDQRTGLFERGVGLAEENIGLRERALNLTDEGISKTERLQTTLAELGILGERQARTGINKRIAAGERDATLRQLEIDTEKEMAIQGANIENAEARQQFEEMQAAKSEADAELVREQEAISTITAFGKHAVKSASSGIAQTGSLRDRRDFYKKQAVKGTLSKVMDISIKAKGHKTQAFIQKQTGAIAQFNLNAVRQSNAVKASNARLQASLKIENLESQSREIDYQKKLAQQKRENSIDLIGTTHGKSALLKERFDANYEKTNLLSQRMETNAGRDEILNRRYGIVGAEGEVLGARKTLVGQERQILGERGSLLQEEGQILGARQGLLGQEGALLGRQFENQAGREQVNQERYGILQDRHAFLDQRYQALDTKGHLLNAEFDIVDSEEQIKLVGAENKFNREDHRLNVATAQSGLNYQERGVGLFASDRAAMRRYEGTYLDLAQSGINENYRHTQHGIDQWYQYQGAVEGFNQQQLNLFRSMTTDEFNLNTQLLGLYRSNNDAHLAELTGEAITIAGNNANLQGWLSGAGSILGGLGGWLG